MDRYNKLCPGPTKDRISQDSDSHSCIKHLSGSPSLHVVQMLIAEPEPPCYIHSHFTCMWSRLVGTNVGNRTVRPFRVRSIDLLQSIKHRLVEGESSRCHVYLVMIVKFELAIIKDI